MDKGLRPGVRLAFASPSSGVSPSFQTPGSLPRARAVGASLATLPARTGGALVYRVATFVGGESIVDESFRVAKARDEARS